MSDNKKKYLEKLKAIQREHKPDPKSRSKNKTWKREWKNFIKYDYWWDSGFLFDLIVYKLEQMRTGFEYLSYTANDKKICTELDVCIALGKKIVEDNYDEAACDYMEKHHDKQAHWKSKKDYNTWVQLCNQSREDRQADINKFFQLIATYIDSWWD